MNYQPSRENTPLIEFALKGLEKCWMPSEGRWSHVYHLDGREQPNESIPASDVFYTLNVLLGMTRVDQVPANLDIGAIFRRNVVQLLQLPVSNYAFGMAMWAAAELHEPLPTPVLTRIEAMLADKGNWFAFSAQDIGMILIGVIAQAKRQTADSSWLPLANALFDFVVEHYHCPSSLFFNSPRGLRRYFASFATQTYLTLACYIYGEFANHSGAIALANSSTRKLLDLQGPNGEWPWFFDVPHGTVVDFYEIYSVHQYGMAPAFLQLAERHGVPGARNALTKGFLWVFGENQMHQSMLMPATGLSIRSQVRSNEMRTKIFRIARAICNATLGRASGLADPARLQLRLECRSYELGWILWSFGKRSDLPELTHHSVFSEQVRI
jgi:hypothetical protein